MARKYIRDRHILLNAVRVNIGSTQLRDGDKISINPKSKDNEMFKGKPAEDHVIPDWLKWDKKKAEAVVSGKPNVEDMDVRIDIAKIIEFYSR
jgi:small subunit ribosomal protein S4